MNVHFGCGTNRAPGWVNCDLRSALDRMGVPEGPAVRAVDLREPLPFEDDSVSMIFSEHVIEHLTKWEGWSHLKECHRILRPGGCIRLGWPALELLIEAYARRDERYRDFVAPHIDGHTFWTWDEFFSDCLFMFEHRYAYTSRHLADVLGIFGFRDVRTKTFGCSDHGFDIDVRDDPATLYVEAVK